MAPAEVLIADDEPDICFRLARLVKRQGIVPHVVADGAAAVALVRGRRGLIRAGFLGVRMPRLGGMEALGRIRAIDPGVRCCLMTAHRLERAVGAWLARNQVLVLSKPFELSQALDALEAMVGPAEGKAGARMTRVALVFPSRYPPRADVLRGVSRYVGAGRNWLVSDYREGDVAAALAGKPDGVIGMIGSGEAAAKLEAWGGPVVNTGSNFPNGRFARVGPAEAAVGAAAADHLLELGHRRVAIVAPPGVPGAERFKAGFLKRLSEAGVRCETAPDDLFESPAPPAARDPAVGWVRGLSGPAAVFATSDLHAMRVSRACRAAGLRVPEDVAVLGAMNDAVLCESCAPPLSSVGVAGEAIGFEAARVLERMLAGGPRPARRIELPPAGVVVRGSTAPTAAGGPA